MSASKCWSCSLPKSGMVSLAGRAEGFAWVSLGELLKYHLSSDSPGSLFVGLRFTSRSNVPAGGLPLTLTLPRSLFPLLEPGWRPGFVRPCPGCLGFSLRTSKCTFLPFCDHPYKHLEARDRHLLLGKLALINNILQSTITGVGNVCGWSVSLLENDYSSEQKFSSREPLLLTNFSTE